MYINVYISTHTSEKHWIWETEAIKLILDYWIFGLNQKVTRNFYLMWSSQTFTKNLNKWNKRGTLEFHQQFCEKKENLLLHKHFFFLRSNVL